jgi:hypothetical protein
VIKATVYDGRNPDPIVILGLSGENMARLMADEPILVNLADVGLPAQRIAVVGGRTEADIAKQLKAHFGTPPDTTTGDPA